MIMSDRREHDEYASGVRAELNGSYWLDAPERDGHTQATAAGAKPWRRPKPRRGVAGIPRPVPTDPAPISGGRSRVRHLDTPAGPHPQERPVSTGSHAAAAERPSVIAVGRFAPGRHRSPDQWRGPKDGAVRVTKSLRRSPTAGGVLTAHEAGEGEVEGVPARSREHGTQTVARLLWQRTESRSPSSWRAS